MLPHLESFSNRELRWRCGATKLGTQVASGFGDVRALGRLDCSLRKAVQDVFDTLDEATPGTEGGGMTDYLYLSKLWVLGAYEAARSLDEWLAPEHQCKERVKKLKRSLERVRMPLAKLEAAERFPGDKVSGTMVGSREEGFAWEVADGVVVGRNELADEFLSVLDCFPELPLPVGSESA